MYKMYKAIRYIGSKQNVLPFLEEHLFCHLKSENASFFDGFAGTGIVSQYVAENYPNVKISGGDISLYADILFNILNIGSCFQDLKLLEKILGDFFQMPAVEGLFFQEFSNEGDSVTYPESRNFFHADSAKQIDSFKKFIIESLKNKKINENQAKVMLFFILSYACKVANTTSVFAAFLKSKPKTRQFNNEFVKKIIEKLKQIHNSKLEVSFYLGDILDNLNKIDNQKGNIFRPPLFYS